PSSPCRRLRCQTRAFEVERPRRASEHKSSRRRNTILDALRHETRSEEHTSELQSQSNLVCRLLLENKNISATSRKVRRTDFGQTRTTPPPWGSRAPARPTVRPMAGPPSFAPPTPTTLTPNPPARNY